MERVIKFRLRYDNNPVGYEKWYSGSLSHRTGMWTAKPCWLYSADSKYWNPEYITHNKKDQFTGLLDSKGKEIYEGDMVAFNSYYIGDSHIKSNKGEVKYGNGSFYIDYDMAPELCEEEIFNECMEIIGNIYSNPELA